MDAMHTGDLYAHSHAETRTLTYTRRKGPILIIVLLYLLVLSIMTYQMFDPFDAALPGRFIPGTLEIESGLVMVVAYFLVPLLYLWVMVIGAFVLFHALKALFGNNPVVRVNHDESHATDIPLPKVATRDPLRDNLLGGLVILMVYGLFNLIAMGMPMTFAFMDVFYGLLIRSALGLCVLIALLALALALYGLSLKPTKESNGPSAFQRMLGGLIVFDLAVLAALLLYFIPLSDTVFVTYPIKQDGTLAIQIHSDYRESFAGYTKALHIPETHDERLVTSVADAGFADVSILGEITMPDSMRHIGNHAFRGLTSLETLTLNHGLESIGHYAFERAIKLSNVIIPASVQTIGEGAFLDCTRLQSITFLSTDPPQLHRYALKNTHKDLIIYVPFDALTHYQEHEAFAPFKERIQPLTD
ncbi:MAG: leucine-rich repeat domain-containing protein [Acholeplasmatales bacterium]|nr:MAG: leucine-rich repeat domain-containing protein [Acholeplasmatales bacterium]